MAFLLRQIVAGPRSRHPEADLDLCYVTPQIIATSGPSCRYPQRVYRNPLDQFVKFLDQNHGNNWAICEFRAEGAGYHDEEVYGRVWHYPWPDHHPPPFRLVPIIIAEMKNWLAGKPDSDSNTDKNRVIVVHCKAGKGRSGTMACSYLISECGWKQEEALARFTERRMRPGFGPGVSIPSQLRWVGYVDRWTKYKKKYLDRKIEILELHAWGLRNGVEIQVEGYVNEGKTIKAFHHFTKEENLMIQSKKMGEKNITSTVKSVQPEDNLETSRIAPENSFRRRSSKGTSDSFDDESLRNFVTFKPSSRIILPTSDVNIDLERRSRASMGWKMVTAVAHFWFNCFFEGQGPEQDGKPNESGIFEIDWDKMDGIKGSSKKGAKALDRLAVVWKAYLPDIENDKRPEEVVTESVPKTLITDLKDSKMIEVDKNSSELAAKLSSADKTKLYSLSSSKKNIKEDNIIQQTPEVSKAIL